MKKGKVHGFPNLVFGGAFFKKLLRVWGAEPRGHGISFLQSFFFVPFAAKKKAPNRYRLRYFVGTRPLRKKRLCQNGKAVRFKKEKPTGPCRTAMNGPCISKAVSSHGKFYCFQHPYAEGIREACTHCNEYGLLSSIVGPNCHSITSRVGKPIIVYSNDGGFMRRNQLFSSSPS
jgi:hypothetical protein